jgi:pyruvate dehydrogenase E2 component (dihydrolipoamide acetyltransferase)
MTTVIRMPAFTATMETGKVINWLVEEGARVEKGQVIAEVETDKAIAEVESPVGGVVKTILVAAGDDDVDIETPLLELVTEEDADEPAASAAPAGTSAPGSTAAEPDRARAASKGPEVRLAASPSARRVARDAGVDLQDVKGSGPGGRITKEDVLAHVNAARPATETGLPEVAPMRLAIARAMVQSKSSVPHFYTQTEVTIDELVRLKDRLCRDNPETRITLTTLFVVAVSRALAEVKEARFRWENGTVVYKEGCDIGVAVAVDGGVVAPVVRNADSLDITAIATRLNRLIADSRAGTVKQADLGDASLTISNLGMFSIDAFYPIVNLPEPLIIGIGRSRRVPLVVDEQVKIRSAVTITQAIDHRVIDGATAGRFADVLRGFVEAPETSGLLGEAG